MSIALAVGGIAGLLTKAMSFFEGDDKRQAELAIKELDNLQAQVMGQQEINKQESQHRSIFVAGWRPFIGWVCGFSLLFEFILRPFIVWLSVIYFPDSPIIPSISDVLLELVFAMLGLGGLRTFEKYKTISK